MTSHPGSDARAVTRRAGNRRLPQWRYTTRNGRWRKPRDPLTVWVARVGRKPLLRALGYLGYRLHVWPACSGLDLRHWVRDLQPLSLEAEGRRAVRTQDAVPHAQDRRRRQAHTEVGWAFGIATPTAGARN